MASPASPNLGAVRDPPGLIVAGRISKLSTTVSTLRDWSKLPLPESDEMSDFFAGGAIGRLIDLDQPIDFAVAIAGSGLRMRPRIAFSAALKDIDRAKATLSERYKLVPGDNGSLVLQDPGRTARSNEDEQDESSDEEDVLPGARQGDRSEGRHLPCELSPAYGVATTRLVCGWSAKALSELTPWLTRTQARVTTSSDLHVELRMGPLRTTISGQKRLLGSVLAGGLGGRLDSSGSRQLIASAVGDVVDFALDLDRAVLDLQMKDDMATETLALSFSQVTSSLARIATAHPERSEAAPVAFWQMPGDANFAFFERGIDDTELVRGRELALHAADEALADEGLKDADRKFILEALGKLASSAPVAYASGLDVDAARKALALERSHADLSDPVAFGEAERVSAGALLGWRVITWDEPATKWIAAFKDLAAGLRRPTVVAAYRASGHDTPPPALYVAPMPKGATLPSGAQHYVLELHPFHSGARSTAPVGTSKPKATIVTGKPVAIHLILVPDGARTWLGVGAGDALASKLASAIGQGADKLAGRTDLSPLRAPSLGAAGFVTLVGVLEGAWALSPMMRGKLLDEVAALPKAGIVPIAFSTTASVEKPGQVTARLDTPRAAIEEAAAIINAHGF